MIAVAKSTDKAAGPLESALLKRSLTEPEIRLSRSDIGDVFAEIGDPALLGLLSRTPSGSALCRVGNAVLVVDLPPVRSAAAHVTLVPDTERVTSLEKEVTEIKGSIAEMLALLKAKA